MTKGLQVGSTVDDEAVRRGAPLLRRSATGAVVGVVMLTAPTAGAQIGRHLDPAPEPPRWVQKAERLAERYDCSRDGLPDGRLPQHAVVRVDGKVRLTSFAEGWAIHQDRGRGTLMSVCAR